MAIALVGSVGATQAGNSPLQGAFGQATTAGNLLVAWVTSTTNTGDPTIDQSWSKAVYRGAAGAAGDRCGIYYKANCGASETAPTITLGTDPVRIKCAEFSGAATASPLEQTAGNDGTTSPVTATAAGADAQSGNLVLASQRDTLSKAATCTMTHTYNNGATANMNDKNDSTSVANKYLFSWGLTTGNSSADNVQASDDSMSLTNIVITLASFKPSGAAAAFQPRPEGMNFQDPGWLAKVHDAWERKRGILVPRLWTPEGATI